MRVVEETGERLVLRETPWLQWLVGGLFIAGGLFAFASGERAFGGGFAAAGAALIVLFANTVTVTFERQAGRVTRAATGMVRRNEATHPLDDIAGVKVEAGASAAPSRAYRIALLLSSGARVPLTVSYSSGKAAQEHAAEAIRRFLNLRELPEVRIPGFRDMFRIMRDPDPAQRLAELTGGASAEYEAVLRRDPDNIEALRQLATALALQNRAAEARPYLEAARDNAAGRGNAALAAQLDEMLKRLDEATRRRG